MCARAAVRRPGALPERGLVICTLVGLEVPAGSEGSPSFSAIPLAPGGCSSAHQHPPLRLSGCKNLTPVHSSCHLAQIMAGRKLALSLKPSVNLRCHLAQITAGLELALSLGAGNGRRGGFPPNICIEQLKERHAQRGGKERSLGCPHRNGARKVAHRPRVKLLSKSEQL